MPSSNHLIETSPMKLVFLIRVGGLHPGDALGLLGPERIRFARGAIDHHPVFGGIDMGVLGDLGADREARPFRLVRIWHRTWPSLGRRGMPR